MSSCESHLASQNHSWHPQENTSHSHQSIVGLNVFPSLHTLSRLWCCLLALLAQAQVRFVQPTFRPSKSVHLVSCIDHRRVLVHQQLIFEASAPHAQAELEIQARVKVQTDQSASIVGMAHSATHRPCCSRAAVSRLPARAFDDVCDCLQGCASLDSLLGWFTVGAKADGGASLGFSPQLSKEDRAVVHR